MVKAVFVAGARETKTVTHWVTKSNQDSARGAKNGPVLRRGTGGDVGIGTGERLQLARAGLGMCTTNVSRVSA